MRAPTADEFRFWLIDVLRSREQLAGLTLHVVPLAPDEIDQIPIRPWGSSQPFAASETIGFRVRLCAHRVERSEAEERLDRCRRAIDSALGEEIPLPGGAEFEGTGEPSELDEDPDQRTFAISFSTFLGVGEGGSR